ncbi:S-layer homology domain-containing protein [Arthrobacter sp. efr-133-TYG-118]|uniref:S-layer homology domain-containing protein n=1 Tax=Arthrobacter sp. efr-133-TYG-118 TaxID=3040279 RepID=UPI00254E4F27|nr:S-layer homology domain-containing protein [Arthrobacter sp. efr-133-TYG-118]
MPKTPRGYPRGRWFSRPRLVTGAAVLMLLSWIVTPAQAEEGSTDPLPGTSSASVSPPQPTPAAQAMARLKGHRHSKVCGGAPPGYASCHAEIDDEVAGPLAAGQLLPAGYGPADLQSAYRLPSLTAGIGRTVAVVDPYDAPTVEADLAVYRTRYGQTPCSSASGCFRKVDQDGGSSLPPVNAAWAQETSLDVQMVSAACPNCSILLVEARSNSLTDLGTAVNTAVNLGANAVSMSFGGPEVGGVTRFDGAYFNHPGIPLVASSGDNGYTNATAPPTVNYPASSPNVVAVGGTTLTLDTSKVRGWTERAWGGAASGAPGPGSGCSAYEPKPAWQHDTGCPNRTVADVASVADPSTGVAVYDSTPSNGMSGWMVFGGTSAAAPVIAATYALAGPTPAGISPAQLAYSSPWALNDLANGANGTCAVPYLCTAGYGYDGPTGLGTAQGLTAFTPSSPPSFTDIPASYPFYVEVTWMAYNGITTGYPDGTFRPVQPVTREAMAAFLYRLKGSPTYIPPVISPFRDIGPLSSFYKEITWLASTGITTGYPDGTYRPLDPVNRDAMAAFLYRLAGKPSYTPPGASPFTDLTPASPFYLEITWLASTGITTGYADGTYRPLNPVNRDAMAAFMYRYNAKIGR